MAPPGIILFSLTITFAAVDWMMSLEPEWYSTMFGVYYFAGSLLSRLRLHRRGHRLHSFTRALRGVVTIEHVHDIGKLLFAFVVFWTYIAFSQYFLIWYANIPEETIVFHGPLPGSVADGRASCWRSATS